MLRFGLAHVVFIYSLLLCFLGGCRDNYASVSFVKVESERTKLIDGIESYQRSTNLRASLVAVRFNGKKVKTILLRKADLLLMHTITIKNYLHLGFSGEMNVGFFNDRLISATFYPSDSEKYVQAIAKATGIKFDSTQEATLPSHTSVRLGTDYKGREYVDWSDLRLDKEVQLWIERYS